MSRANTLRFLLSSFTACAFVALIGCQGQPKFQSSENTNVASSQAALYQLPLNEIQLIGSHNSYKKAIDPALLLAIAQSDERQALGLDYSHPPLQNQLDLGLRKLELDVFYDPEGGLFVSPMGLQLAAEPSGFDSSALSSPGFKVMHVQDIDFRSHCATLKLCLQQVLRWSQDNQNHAPLFITINPKQGKIPLAGFTEPLVFNALAFDQLDAEIKEVLGSKLYTPDQFRSGEDDLTRAVDRGWPSVESLAGKVIVILDTGEQLREFYKDGHAALVGRAMFMNAPEGQPESAILIINDPIAEFERIQSLVKQGYIVRTRTDADTVEARTGDKTRMRRAFDSGAQILSTDYYVSDSRFSAEFLVRFPDGSYFRQNPVSR